MNSIVRFNSSDLMLIQWGNKQKATRLYSIIGDRLKSVPNYARCKATSGGL